ncbi:alpha/beta fold hydrolase [Rhodovulum sp. DZ06]|uniref:alpha/beta fold hydrolase n=1 Tax=Rhodovulum sp. DZ06 TaxID=3425126 RepID=UPI003D33299D
MSRRPVAAALALAPAAVLAPVSLAAPLPPVAAAAERAAPSLAGAPGGALRPIAAAYAPASQEAAHHAAHHWAEIGGARLSWREAGDPGAPALLLLGGAGTAAEIRRLLPRLARTHHVIAPDTPFASAVASSGGQGDARLAEGARRLTLLADALGLGRFGILAFAPSAALGMRLLAGAPERVDGFMVRSGGACLDGLAAFRGGLAAAASAPRGAPIC